MSMDLEASRPQTKATGHPLAGIVLLASGTLLAVLAFATDWLDGLESHLGAAFLALTVIVLTVLLSIWIVSYAGVPGIMHAILLCMTALSFSVTTLFVMLSEPDLRYTTMFSSFGVLDSAIRVQTAVLLFVISYGLVAAVITRTQTRSSAPSFDSLAPWASWAVWIAIAANGLYLTETLVPLSPAIFFMFHVIRESLGPVAFVPGLMWSRLGAGKRTLLIGAFVVFAAVNFAANSRGFALMPFVMWSIGLLASPEYGRAIKIRAVVLGAVAFPWIMAVGNITRTYTGSIGYENLGERFDILGQALNEGGVVSEHGVVTDTVLRLFQTGGHSLIARTPEERPFLGFNMTHFFEEAFHVLIPTFVLPYDRFAMDYAGTSILLQYGFRISEATSVPVSTVGSLYVISGFLSVILGAAILAGLYGCLAYLVQRCRRNSLLQYAILAAGINSAIWGYNRDAITVALNLPTLIVFITIVITSIQVIQVSVANSRKA